MSLLNVQNLSVHFRTFNAVDHVSFTLDEGRTLAVVGESGCGKTSVALALLRLTPSEARIEADSITLHGKELTRLTEREMCAVRGKDAAMVFQDPLTALNPVYTVGEQIAEGLRLHENLGRNAAWERAVEAMHEVGIPEPRQRAREYPHQLSGGLRQRVTIAQAIACRPALLVADEPTTALDVSLQAQIIDLLLKLQADLRLSILLITHDLGVVAEMAHRVAVMYAGQIVEQADVKSLFARPLHPYTRGLLQSVPGLVAFA
jgi:ABC-type dipeptide/oligopeptide/nickel transport system ATPase component